MREKPKQSRLRKRPLLVAGVGITVISIAACGGFSCGNLLPPTCPDGGLDTGTRCKVPTDAGRPDGGTADGGTADGGTDGGTGGDI